MREMVCSQEYSLQRKAKKCPLRFSFCFKKTQQILKAKEKQIFFFLCLETTAAYYKGLIQGPRLTSEDFESGARMASNQGFSLPCAIRLRYNQSHTHSCLLRQPVHAELLQEREAASSRHFTRGTDSGIRK